MSYITMQLAVSLDGYIARKDGSVDFLEEMESSVSEKFQKFIDSIDVIVMGRNTYEVMLKLGGIPFKDKKIYVLTSKRLESELKNVIFTNKNIELIVKEEKGHIWLFGGAKVIQSFINLDLVDELQLHIVPQIIGEGIPLFLDSKGIKDLNLVNHEKFGNSILLTYKKNL